MQMVSGVRSPGGRRWPAIHWRWARASTPSTRRGDAFAVSSHGQPPRSAAPASLAQGAAETQAATPPPALASFDDFYARHEQPLYGYLRRLLPSHEIAVEVAQEAFFRAWRQFDTLLTYDRPEAWLYRVATNLAISHLRHKAPLSFSSLIARLRAEAPDREELAAGDLFASSFDLEGDAAERDLIERILRALPDRQRAALLLSAQGFTSEEIAAALAATPANARQLLSRARERFRRLYDDGRRATP
ncbi:MAG TPA: RNA polymerase sigma factor [Ktedonobacterales bacterium]